MVQTRAMTLAGGESVSSAGSRTESVSSRAQGASSPVSANFGLLDSLRLNDDPERAVDFPTVANEGASFVSELTELSVKSSVTDDEANDDPVGADDVFPGQTESQFAPSEDKSDAPTVIKQEGGSDDLEQWTTVPTSRNKAMSPVPVPAPARVDRPVASWNAFGSRNTNRFSQLQDEVDDEIEETPDPGQPASSEPNPDPKGKGKGTDLRTMVL